MSIQSRWRVSSYLAAASIAALAVPATAGEQGPVPSPFPVLDPGPVDGFATIGFGIDEHRFFRAVFDAGDVLHLDDFVLAGGEQVDLTLRPVSALEPGAKAIVVRPDGSEYELAPTVATFSGHVKGRTSVVFLAVAPDMLNGYVSLDGKLHAISSGGDQSGGIALVTSPAALDEMKVADAWCGTVSNVAQTPSATPPELGTQVTVEEAKIFVEVDHQLRNLFGNDTAAANYAALLYTAMGEIYRRDVGFRLLVPNNYLRVWNTVPPWGILDSFGDITAFRNYWVSNHPLKNVDRAAVEALTTPVFGGVAYQIGTACSNSVAYGITSVYGSFPYPLQHQSGANWDIFASSHEVGHTFGSPHTFDYNPPITCNDGSGPDLGTIMSYCHLDFGMGGPGLRFHPKVQTVIQNHLANKSCMRLVPTALGDYDGDKAHTASDLAAFDAYQSQGFDSIGAFEIFDMDQSGVVDACDRAYLLALVNGSTASVTGYGCGNNPAGALTWLGGLPTPGGTVTFGLQNPLGNHPAGSTTFLLVGPHVYPQYPCGRIVSNIGMDGGAGEWLVAPGAAIRVFGPPLPATGTSDINLTVASDCAAIGTKTYVQGVIVGGSIGVGVSEAFELLIAP